MADPTYCDPMSLGWLAADAAAELPSRHGSWEANPAGLNAAGQYQAVLHDKIRRLLITAVPEGIAVSSWPYGGESPAGLPRIRRAFFRRGTSPR